MSNGKCIIQAEGVSFRYGQESPKILDEISFSLPGGRITGLTGTSGSGKSTLAHVLCGVIPHGIKGVFEGCVSVGGEDMKKLTLPQIAKSVGMVFQQVDDQLFLPTVEEEIAFALENFCCPQEDMIKIVNEELSYIGIQHLRHCNPSSLSGGEKRLAAIASVLVMDPDCIILDEPFTGLDEHNCSLVQQIIMRLKDLGKAVLLIEHAAEHLKAAEELYVMSQGRIIKKLEGAELHGFLQNQLGGISLPKTEKSV